MATQTRASASRARIFQQFRDLFADAPEIGKKRWRTRFTSSGRRLRICRRRWTAGRRPSWQGVEVAPLAPGGAKRLRAFLRLLRGNLSQGAPSTLCRLRVLR